MLQHIIAFSLYTLAMIGIFFIAFVVYKKTIESNGSKFGEGIKIENMLRLSQRKSLYIVNVQGERFLIASDPENTTFLAKLASKAITPKETEGLTLDSKRITETPLYSPNDIKTTDEDSKKQVEKYIKELSEQELRDETIVKVILQYCFDDKKDMSAMAKGNSLDKFVEKVMELIREVYL